MSKQIIVTIGREYGSGGLEIATRLAKELEIGLYDRNLLSLLSEERHIDPQVLEQYDEHPKNKLISRRVRGLSNAPEDHVAQMEFEFLWELAHCGKSFVVVGRCGEEVLKDFPGVISVFVRADREFRKERLVAEGRADSLTDADQQITQVDRARRTYHDQHCQGKWGHAETYDLVINSSRLGIPATAEVLEHYVTARVNTR